MGNLHTLVYLSSSSHQYSQEELNNILTVSRKNNSEKNISGILIYSEGNILQVLEGNENDLRTLYKKIGADLRHKDLILLQDNSIEQRNFEDWSMGFKTATAPEFKELEGYYDLRKNKNISIKDTSIIKSIVSDFIDQN